MAYLSLEEARTYLGFAAGDTLADDALITSMITAAQAFLDAQCGMTFEADTETRYYDADAVHEDVLTLDRPLLTVTTLTNADGTVLSSATYWLTPRNVSPQWFIELKSGYAWLFDIDGWVSVAGTWGYVATVPEDVKMAMRELVNLLYKGKDKSTLGTSSAFVSGGTIVMREGLPPWTSQVIKAYRSYL